jgi:UDP-sulfoquinovose synthase
MKVLIMGIDGYMGWSLAVRLAHQDYEVTGVDNLARRGWVNEMGSVSAMPIETINERRMALKASSGRRVGLHRGDLTSWEFAYRICHAETPDAIVYLAEQPSAPYSMLDADHAAYTQHNNVIGTLNTLFAIRDECPEAHLIKLGTMGEYGTPNVDIPEGFFDCEFRGRSDRLMFPRDPGSFYHASKVHDTHNIRLACKTWGLRSTDIMQGVVYGTHIDEMEGDSRIRTRFDFDQCFGTVLNRFVAQTVIGEPMTVFGHGGQRRGFLPLRDAMQCLQIAIDNPPEAGEYRTFNQFLTTYSVQELADLVRHIAEQRKMKSTICFCDNPRIEAEDHYYEPDHSRLTELGYRPSPLGLDVELDLMLRDLSPHRTRIEACREALEPTIRWK